MIVVRVELHSARTRKVTEIARAIICNVGGTHTRRDYICEILRGRSKEAFDLRRVHRTGEINSFPSLYVHVWNLVATALTSMGYGKDSKDERVRVHGRALDSNTPARADSGESDQSAV